MFVNATKVYQFKAKNSEVKYYTQWLGNVPKDFPVNNMKKTGLTEGVKFFSVDYNPIDNNNILDIHKYLMKITWYKIMFGLIKKIFIGLLSSVVNASYHTKYIYLSNQRCKIQPTLINLHPNEYCQEFHYYPSLVKLDRRVGSCNTLNDLSNKVCIANKLEDLNLSVLSMITGINESKTLTEHISFECKCKLDGTKFNSYQWWNNDKYRCEHKKHHIYEKEYIWSPSTCIYEIGKYLASFMDDSVITCD